MKKSNLVIGVSCVLASATGSGCSLMKNMDEMHDSTVHVAAKTDHLVQKTDHMAETTDHMAKTTDGMATTTVDMAKNVADTACTAKATYEALKQGNTLAARTGLNALDEMENAGSIEKKIFHAGAYFKAFEFQIWNCADPDSDKYLQAFYMQAAEEFTRVLPDYLTTDQSKWSVSPTSTNNWVNNLYAVSVTMQELNANIVTAYKLGKWAAKPQSILDLIQSSLSRKTYFAAHPDKATRMDHEFLANEDLLIQLLQIRMNFLAAMALAKVSNLERKGSLGLPGLVTGFKMLMFSWTPKLWQLGQDHDIAQIKHFTRFLYGSNDMRAYLRSLGVQPIMDTKIWNMYAHMATLGIVEKKIARPKTDKDLAFNNVQDAIQGFLDQVTIFFHPEKFKKIPELDHPELFSY